MPIYSRHALRAVRCARLLGALGLAGTVALALPGAALAGPVFGFSNITGNSAVNAAAGESQLSLALADLGSGEVRFDVRNDGPEAMSITTVFFEDNTLLGFQRLIDADDNGGDSGVDFTPDGPGPQKASPAVLPGGSAIGFDTTGGFLADADTPQRPMNGVNPGEELGVVFALASGLSFQDLEDALGRDLRVGIHVTAFDDGGSEAFVAPGHPVPAPATAGLLAAGLLGLASVTFWRRRGRQPEAIRPYPRA